MRVVALLKTGKPERQRRRNFYTEDFMKKKKALWIYAALAIGCALWFAGCDAMDTVMEMLGFGSVEEDQKLPGGEGDENSPGGEGDENSPDSAGGENPLVSNDDKKPQDSVDEKKPLDSEDEDDNYEFDPAVLSFYVSGSGSDTDDGLTEGTAFKTLDKAYMTALADTNGRKRVVVLTDLSEKGLVKLAPSALTSELILIEGKPDGVTIKRSTGTNESVLDIKDGAKITFKHITINGNKDASVYHRAISMTGTESKKTEVTLDNKTVVTGKITTGRGGSVQVFRYAQLVMNAGSVIEKSFAGDGGGVLLNGGTFVMNDGDIRNNSSTMDGGGVYMQSDSQFGGSYGDFSVFELKGGVISSNISGDGGGVACLRGTFMMSGGVIGGNTATTVGTTNSSGAGGGVYLLGNTGSFMMKGGVIYGNAQDLGDLRNIANTNKGAALCKSSSNFTVDPPLIDTTDVTIDMRP
jgi:hypothetical protein